MKNLSLILLLVLVGCSSAKIDKADKDDFSALEKQFDPVAWQKKQDAKKKKKKSKPNTNTIKRTVTNLNKYICIDKNGTGTDKRIIEYFPKKKGMNHCRVEYTKFGKKKIPYKAKKTLKQCKVVFERIPRKLKKAKYKCELEKKVSTKVVEVKKPAPKVALPIPTPKPKVPAPSPKKEQKKEAKSNNGTQTCKSKNGGDVRKIELIEMPNGGCIVEYTKFGKKKNVVEGAPGSKYCNTVYKRIPRKLKAAGFSCVGN